MTNIWSSGEVEEDRISSIQRCMEINFQYVQLLEARQYTDIIRFPIATSFDSPTLIWILSIDVFSPLSEAADRNSLQIRKRPRHLTQGILALRIWQSPFH